MDLLTAIGVNHTIFYQLAIFVVTYLLLKPIAVDPYFRLYLKRVEKTEGNSEIAVQAMSEFKQLEQQYNSLVLKNYRSFQESFEAEAQQVKKDFLSREEQIKAKFEERKLNFERQLESEVQKTKSDLAVIADDLGSAVYQKVMESPK